MNQFELNQIRSKLRRLDLDDQFIERYLEKLIRNKEPFVTASKAIDRWEKKDSGQFVLQALACGLIAALAGGSPLFSSGVNGVMNDASLIALFSVGTASTLTVLFLAFRRTFRQEQERTLMRRMRRRLDQMLRLSQQ